MTPARLRTYKLVTVLWGACLLMAMYFATVGEFQKAGLFIVAAIAFVLGQAALIKCPHCGTRPGLWLLAIWTLLLDPALYIADVLFLRNCPKCRKPLLRVGQI